MSWKDVETSLSYFSDKGVYVDEGLLIDQFQCLEQFLSENVKSSSWCNKSSAERWKEFFDSRLFIGGVSEFLKVVQFHLTMHM